MGNGTLLSWLMEVVNGFPFWGLSACVTLTLLLNSLYPAMSFLTYTFLFSPPSLCLWRGSADSQG